MTKKLSSKGMLILMSVPGFFSSTTVLIGNYYWLEQPRTDLLFFGIFMCLFSMMMLLMAFTKFNPFYSYAKKATYKSRTERLLNDFQWMAAFKGENESKVIMFVNKDGTKGLMREGEFLSTFEHYVDAFMEARKTWRKEDKRWLNEFLQETEGLNQVD